MNKVYISASDWWKRDMVGTLLEARNFLATHGVNMDDLHMGIDDNGMFLIIEDPTLAMLFKLMNS